MSRKLASLGHDARLMPAKYVRPYSKGQKNDFNDADAIAEAVQRPTMKFVATKTAEQLDLQALHRVRERLVSQRTGIINQIRAFMLERGIAVRQGIGFLRTELAHHPCDAHRRRARAPAGRAVLHLGFPAGWVRAAGEGERHKDLQEQLKPPNGGVFLALNGIVI